jgi:hypothetical protein
MVGGKVAIRMTGTSLQESVVYKPILTAQSNIEKIKRYFT